MANQLSKAHDISPSTLAPDDATANNLGADFDPAQWASAWYACEGTPNHGPKQSTGELNLRLDYAFDGATAIEILPQFADFETTATPASGGYRDAAGDVQRDVITLEPGNVVDDPGAIDIPLNIRAASHVRILARAVGGTTPTLQASITAG